MANFRLLFGILGSRRHHLKPNHLSPPSQSQHLANSHQPRRSNTTITPCPFLYNPAPFPNKAEFSGELLLCVAPFLSLVPKPRRRDTPTGPRLPPDTSSSLPSSSFSGAGSSHSPLLSGLWVSFPLEWATLPRAIAVSLTVIVQQGPDARGRGGNSPRLRPSWLRQTLRPLLQQP